MSRWITVGLVMMMVAMGGTARADVTNTYYVSTNGTPTYPFDTWAKATTNLQLAVLVAEQAYGPGTNCVVLVTNGTYTTPTYGYYGYRTQTNPVITSMSGNGTIVTVVTASAHAIAATSVDNFAGGQVGQWVVIKGNSVSNEYRGGYRVASVIDANTFTYAGTGTVACTPGADAKSRAVADWAMLRITKPVTVRSVNGPAATILDVNAGTAWTVPDRNRRGVEVLSTATNALIEGFTIRNAFIHNGAFGEQNPDSYGHRRGIEPYVPGSSGCGVSLLAGTLRNCLIHTCQLQSGGGQGLHGAGVKIVNATATSCVISNNSIGAHGGGGAGFEIETGGLLENSIVVNNGGTGEGYTANDWAGGGGCAKGGTIRNCLFAGNTGVSAGGLHVYGSPTVENCTFSTNTGYTHVTAPQNNDYANHAHSNSAGAVFIRSGSPVLQNNIYYFNRGQPRAGDPSQDYNINTNRLQNPDPSVLNRHSYSCAPELGIATSPGNKTNDPLFVNRLAGDYRLTADSPCINAGTNLTWMTNALDLSGTARLVGQRPDMGAYEFPPRGTSIMIK